MDARVTDAAGRQDGGGDGGGYAVRDARVTGVAVRQNGGGDGGGYGP